LPTLSAAKSVGLNVSVRALFAVLKKWIPVFAGMTAMVGMTGMTRRNRGQSALSG